MSTAHSSLGYSPLDLQNIAKKVAVSAGNFLIDRPTTFELTEKSSINDFATQMDVASEKLIVEQLLAARPDDGIFGEENSRRESRSGVTWVIDPLDGTVNYFYGLPGWNVSIAARVDVDGESSVIAGAVYAPTVGSLWYASRGGGAFWQNSQWKDSQKVIRIHSNNPVNLDRALIGTGFAYDAEKRKSQAKIATEIIPRFRDIRRIGAAAADLCNVASGLLDGYFESGLNEWDYSAGGLICEEAGALVTGLHGELPSPAMTIAAGPHLHAQLLAALNG